MASTPDNKRIFKTESLDIFYFNAFVEKHVFIVNSVAISVLDPTSSNTKRLCKSQLVCYWI